MTRIFAFRNFSICLALAIALTLTFSPAQPVPAAPQPQRLAQEIDPNLSGEDGIPEESRTLPDNSTQPSAEDLLWEQIEQAHIRGDRQAERALAEALPEPARSHYFEGLVNETNPTQPQGGSPFIGINGAACAYGYSNYLDAAVDGDTIYISPNPPVGRLGYIDKNLNFTAASADCTTQSASDVTVNGGDTIATWGGVAEVAADKTVSFHNLILTNGTATFGGILYVDPGAIVTLDNSDLTFGSASNRGGGLRLTIDAIVVMANNSQIYGCVTTDSGLGGGVASYYGSITLLNNSRIGSAANQNYSISNGGGVHLYNGTLSMYDYSKVAGNLADGNGGGVYAEAAGQIHLYDSAGIGFQLLKRGEIEAGKSPTFDNTAYNGGGAYLVGTDTLITLTDHAVISNNKANNSGGGIYADESSEISLNSAWIGDNYAVERGGGIFIANNINTYIQNNTQISYNWSGLYGGAMYIIGDNSPTNIVLSTITQNSSPHYGAIRLNGHSYLTITRTTLSYNTANTGFGGALAASLGTATLNTSVMQHNQAATNGGAIYHESGFMQLTDCDVRYNNANSYGGGIFNIGGMLYFWAVNDDAYLAVNTAVSGGGLYATGSDLIYFRAVVDGMINLNTNIALTGSGGGIYATGSVSVDIYGDVTMTSNTAHDDGGAIYQHGGTLTLDDFDRTLYPRIWINTAYYGNGGGIYLEDPAAALLYGFELGAPLEGNHALEGYGGGIYLTGGSSSVNIHNMLAQNNTSALSGGAIAVMGGATANIQSEFTGAGAKDQIAPHGGMSSICNPNFLAANRYCSEFRFNQAGVSNTGYGGAIFVDGNSGAFINETSFHGNVADWGGAIEVLYGIADAKNSLFTANDGGTNDSTVHIYYLNSTIKGRFNCELCTFADNPSRPVYYVTNAGGSLIKSILWGNGLAIIAGSALFFCDDYDGSILPGTLNISQDPKFITTRRGSYRLGNGSPAINACTTGSGPDLDGWPRPIGGVDQYDMGAFEVPLRVFMPIIAR